MGDLKDEGDSSSKQLNIYVIINGFNYEVTSKKIVDAVDYCYKSFYVTSSKFPDKCKHIWYFFIPYFYKNIRVPKAYMVMGNLIESLKQMNLKEK